MSDSMSDGPRPIILVDCSAGPSQKKNAELGAGRAQGFAIIETVDPVTKRITRTREGVFEPRALHASKSDAVDPAFANVLDWRFSTTLESDLEHGFGSPVTVDDPCSPFKNDWDHKNKSTRGVGGEDPRGKTGLLPQVLTIFDVPGGSYSFCIPIGPTIAAKDGSKIPAGFFVGEPAPATGGTQERASGPAKLNTLALSTFFYADPDQTGQGADGTPASRLGMKIDAYIGDKDTQRYGPEKFETSDWPSIDMPGGGSKKWEVKKTFDKVTGKWRYYVETDAGGGGGGGGSPGWFGNGIDGDVTIPATTGPIYSSGSGAWASDVNYPLAVAVTGSDLAGMWAYFVSIGAGSSSPQPPFFDASKTYAVLLRDAYFHDLTLASNVILIPSRSLICGTGTLSGGSGSAIDNGGNMYDAGMGVGGSLNTNSNMGMAAYVFYYLTSGAIPPFTPVTYLTNYPLGYTQTLASGWIVGGGSHSGHSSGGVSAASSFVPPFDESSSSSLYSGAGGAGSSTAGGAGSGSGTPRGHPLNMLIANLEGGSPATSRTGPAGGPWKGGASGGQGGGGASGWGGIGGNGGAPIIIRFKTITATLAARTNGGDGEKGGFFSTFTGGGGGGGANPGWISIFSDTPSSVSGSVQPGTGGAGSGGGSTGASGNGVGYVYRSSSTASTTVGTS